MRGHEVVASAVTPKRITMEEIELAKIYYDERLATEDKRWIKEQLELADLRIPSWLGFTRGS